MSKTKSARTKTRKFKEGDEVRWTGKTIPGFIERGRTYVVQDDGDGHMYVQHGDGSHSVESLGFKLNKPASKPKKKIKDYTEGDILRANCDGEGILDGKIYEVEIVDGKKFGVSNDHDELVYFDNPDKKGLFELANKDNDPVNKPKKKKRSTSKQEVIAIVMPVIFEPLACKACIPTSAPVETEEKEEIDWEGFGLFCMAVMALMVISFVIGAILF